MKKKVQYYFLFIAIIYSFKNAYSHDAELVNIYTLYKKGSYTEVFKILDKLEKEEVHRNIVHYWKGLIHNKKQEFDLAIL